MISENTGLVSWDTTVVAPGDYSVQVVTTDIHTKLRVAAELIVQVSAEPSTNTTSPRFIHSSPSLPGSIVYAAPGSSVTHHLFLEDGDGVDDITISNITPLPEGIVIINTEHLITRSK